MHHPSWHSRTFTTATLFCPAADCPYIYSYLNLFTTATATNTFSQLPKYPLDKRPFFSATDQPRPQGFSLKKWVGRPTHFLREKPWGRGWRLMKKSRMVTNWYVYDQSRGNRILILLHLYCCSKQKLSTILIANVGNLARFVSLKY